MMNEVPASMEVAEGGGTRWVLEYMRRREKGEIIRYGGLDGK
jgi:hypothetical protein